MNKEFKRSNAVVNRFTQIAEYGTVVFDPNQVDNVLGENEPGNFCMDLFVDYEQSFGRPIRQPRVRVRVLYFLGVKKDALTARKDIPIDIFPELEREVQ